MYDADGNRLIRRDPTLYLPGGQEVRKPKPAPRPVLGITVSRARPLRYGRRPGFNDHHGTASATVSGDSTLKVTRRRMLPFGGDRGTASTSWAGDKGFLGGTKDNTGLTHLGAREYDPNLGRFVSVDPIMDLAQPDQWNGYSYANDNPTTLSDPDGLEPRPWHDPNYDPDTCKNSSSWECHPGTTPGRDGNGAKTGGGSSGDWRSDPRKYTNNPQLGLNTIQSERLQRAYDAGYLNHSFVFPDEDGVLRRACVGRLGCQVASTYLRKAETDGLAAAEIYAAKALAIGWCSEHVWSCELDDLRAETYGRYLSCSPAA